MARTVTVKVELELPANVWQAMEMVAEKFGETSDEWAAAYIKSQLIADAEDYFRIYSEYHFGPICEKILKLIDP